jgi:GNAT superfamily N-acetyltransferase
LNVRLAQERDRGSLIEAIDKFRQALARLRRRPPVSNPAAAEAELDDYISRGFPIYVAEMDKSVIIGYMVCRIDADVLWVESLFVEGAYRRQGVASRLYGEAERLAREIGGEAPYNWIDPDNDAIVQFLKKRGYDVLNLIELRRKRPDEELGSRIKVGDHEYFRQ